MRRFSVIAGVAMMFIFGAAHAQQPIVIKFSHVVAVETPKGKAANYSSSSPRSGPRAA